jgi:uncharacterized protein
MNCRPGCGACCIAISISSAIEGLPDGKPAGVRCIHLTEEYKCAIFAGPGRPKVCDAFKAEEIICGTCREEAMQMLTELELG